MATVDDKKIIFSMVDEGRRRLGQPGGHFGF